MFPWIFWQPIERTEAGESVLPTQAQEPDEDDAAYAKAGCKGDPCPRCLEPTNEHLRAGGVQLCPACFYSWSS